MKFISDVRNYMLCLCMIDGSPTAHASDAYESQKEGLKLSISLQP